jgi:sec-independent protein translocase protein TatC
MPTTDEEAQLEQTKMSFGEHLEELRSALFKSLLALVAGVIVGLFVGLPLVRYIQKPLERALVEHRQRRAEAKEVAWLEAEKAAGRPVPANLADAAHERVLRGGTPHEYLIATEDLAESLENSYPGFADALRNESPNDSPDDSAGASPAANAPPEGMVRIRLYEPLEHDPRTGTISTSAFEPVMVYMKASFAAGLVLASPAIFYFLWQFVAAGLYKSEKQYVHVYLPFSLALFLVGAAIAYYFAFDIMLRFLFWFHEQMGIEPYPKLSDWIMTVVLMPLGFGVSFQLPLVMLVLERIGVFTAANYLAKWRIAIVVISVISMILTPGPDIGSMMLLFVPLTGLYFLGIAMCKYAPGGPIRSPLRDRSKGPEPPKSGPPKPEDAAGS